WVRSADLPLRLWVIARSLTPPARLTSSASSLVPAALEGQSLHHGFSAEPLPQLVHGLLGAGSAAIDEIGEIGAIGIAQTRQPNADESKHRPLRFPPQHL